jgi:hypothetical protein
MPKKYRGEADGNDAMDALHKALRNAWQKAKDDGKEGKDLRVDEWYVRGRNPINWTSIVLVDDDA